MLKKTVSQFVVVQNLSIKFVPYNYNTHNVIHLADNTNKRVFVLHMCYCCMCCLTCKNSAHIYQRQRF